MRDRGTGRIWQKGEIWWVQYYSHGRQIRESTGIKAIAADPEASPETKAKAVKAFESAKRQAEKFLRRRLGEVDLGLHRPSRAVTYEEIRDAFFLDYTTNHRKSLYFDSQGKPRLDKVEHLNRFFSGYRVSEIDTNAMRRFATKLQAEGKKDSTVNRSLSVLRRMLNLAKRERKILDVPFMPMLKEPPPRQGFFEPEAYEALGAALPDYLRLPLAIGYHTAMRLGEVLSLEWSQIDFLANTIGLRAGETKNGQARTIPIVPQLRTLLIEQRARRQDGCPFVCFRLDGKGHATQICSFRKAWYRSCIKVGLGKMEPNPVTGKPVYHGMIFHDLRRSCVRSLVRAGVPERVAMAISGHVGRSVFDRYNIVSGNDLTEAARKLDDYLTQKNGANSGQIKEMAKAAAATASVVN